MGWFISDLTPGLYLDYYRWSTVLLMGFEILYITLMAILGQRSHYNTHSPLTSALYGLMGIAATAVTLWTGLIGWQFYLQPLEALPEYYKAAIVMGTTLFAVFGMQGALMGSRLAHTVGAQDGGPGLPFLNWSRTHGDQSVAHFVGMHALQILPLASFYLFKNMALTLILGGVYGLLAFSTLIQALRSQPVIGRLATVSESGRTRHKV